jgi:hypothetical protein
MAARPLFQPEEPGDHDSWLRLGPCTYTVDGKKYGCVAMEVGESGGNRIAPRARPWQRGEKLDGVGVKSDEFLLDLIFTPDAGEPDVANAWPSDIEAMVAAFKLSGMTGATGTLDLSWKRGLRVKPLEWQRRASATENRGGETMRVRFQEDNEDALDREAFQLVQVKAALPERVDAAQFDAESEGMDVFAFEDITELAANVVGLLNAPGDVAAALVFQGNRLRLACKTVAEAFTTTEPGRDGMNDPRGALMRLKLLELAELGAQAVSEGRPKATRVMTFPRRQTIWTIATELGQNARELMTVNEQIEDFNFIEAGVPVRVFA